MSVANELGGLVREARRALRLSLDQLAARVGCAKSYLSAIETGARANPPSEALLTRIEHELALARGSLCAMAHWHNTPEPVRASVLRLRSQQEAAQALVSHLRRHASAAGGAVQSGPHAFPTPSSPSAPSGGGGRAADGGGVPWVASSLDDLYRSGELRRLVDRVSPREDQSSRCGPAQTLADMLPAQVPLVNLVAAGTPTEFTDLGYPARLADGYINTTDTGDADAFAARVRGDSMEPLYREGDIVVFSPAKVVKSGMDCFVRLEPDHETTFKRVYFEDDGRVRLQPLNSAHAPRVLAREQVAGMYAAVSATRAV